MADTPRIVNLSDTFKCNLMEFMAPLLWLPIPLPIRFALLLCTSICMHGEQRLLLKAETMRTSASIVRASACVCVRLCTCTSTLCMYFWLSRLSGLSGPHRSSTQCESGRGSALLFMLLLLWRLIKLNNL